MKSVRKSLAVLFIASLMTSIASAQEKVGNTFTALSVWQNQSGSTLQVDTFDPSTGKLTGTYINRNPNFQCQGTPYAVVGWSQGNSITFSVNWKNGSENCNSQTAWTGFFAPGAAQMTTLWQLVSNGTTSVDQILKGQDVFRRVTTKHSDSLIKGSRANGSPVGAGENRIKDAIRNRVGE